jgi:hypothetical protein
MEVSIYRKTIYTFLMNDKTKKYTVKCQVCGKEIGDASKPNFAEQHINENPGHLEYRVIVEMLSPSVPDNQPILNAANVTQQATVESQ